MSKRLPFVLAAVLATALIAAGCGDDDETTSSTTSSTTGASGASGATGAGGDSDVVAQVNQICKDTDKQIDQAFEENIPSGAEPSQADLEKAAQAVVPVINDVLDQIRAVDGAEDDPGVSEFIDTAQEDVDQLEDDPSSLGPNSFAAADQAADKAGLTECVG